MLQSRGAASSRAPLAVTILAAQQNRNPLDGDVSYENAEQDGEVAVRSLLKEKHRTQLLGRLTRLDPDQPALWGRLTARRMLAHLCDQMRVTLGEQACAPLAGPARYPILREAFLYVLPWPKGRIQGPPEAFVTPPMDWDGDLATLTGLVERFVSRDPASNWSDHPYFGRMSRRAWGVFCYRHFDHHLRQFDN